VKKVLINVIFTSMTMITLVGCGENSSTPSSNASINLTQAPTMTATIPPAEKTTVKTDVPNYKEGRVQSISFQLDVNKQTKSISQAIEFAKEYFPSDAKQIKKYDVDKMDQVYIFQSKDLSELFSPEVFSDNDGEDKPHMGEFYVRLAHDGDSVGALYVSIGEPPMPTK
jgi:hypothetical protein